MCGKAVKQVLDKVLSPDLPEIVTPDPEADARRAAEQATIAANNDRAARRRRAGANTLLATGAQGASGSGQLSTVLAYGKSRLGQ